MSLSKHQATKLYRGGSSRGKDTRIRNNGTKWTLSNSRSDPFTPIGKRVVPAGWDVGWEYKPHGLSRLDLLAPRQSEQIQANTDARDMHEMYFFVAWLIEWSVDSYFF
jgi:hypothetical protein